MTVLVMAVKDYDGKRKGGGKKKEKLARFENT